MDIHGVQKLTLLDFPGHVACTVFLAGCDFRCPFCHNGGLVLGSMEPVMDDAGLLAFLKKRQGLLDGVAGSRCCGLIFPGCCGPLRTWATP